MNPEELTKEQLDAVAYVKTLSQLKFDCQSVYEWYKKNLPHLCHIENEDCKNFSSFTPKLLADLLGMIKSGDLVMKKKRVKKEIISNEPKEEINIPSNFVEVWNSWKEYRKAKKKKNYASVTYEQIAFEKLIKLSKNNPTEAKLIIEQSIENNWESIFKLNKLYDGKSEQKSTRNR